MAKPEIQDVVRVYFLVSGAAGCAAVEVLKTSKKFNVERCESLDLDMPDYYGYVIEGFADAFTLAGCLGRVREWFVYSWTEITSEKIPGVRANKTG